MNKLTSELAPAPPEGEINSRLNRLSLNLNDLHELVSQLEYKIGEILSGETPKDDSSKGAEISETDLGYKILNLNNLLYSLICKVESIISRVQL